MAKRTTEKPLYLVMRVLKDYNHMLAKHYVQLSTKMAGGIKLHRTFQIACVLFQNVKCEDLNCSKYKISPLFRGESVSLTLALHLQIIW